ncbi:MAG: TspO/MBR family protein, partial [Bryobacteraceae bacterium]
SMRRSNSSLALLGFSAAVAGAAFVGSRYSPRDLKTWLWYRRLKKPPFNPPDAVFPIVLTALYTMMAISGWRVWRHRDSPERTAALRLWVSQLIANAEWTRLFFGKHLPTWSLANLLSLQSTVIHYIFEARKIDQPAAALFVPYAAWVAFAGLLNEEIVRRNPDASKMFPRAA